MYIPSITDEETLFGVYIALPDPYECFIRECRIEQGDVNAVYCPTHITLLAPTPIKNTELIDFISDLKRVVSQVRPFWLRLNGVSSFEPVSNVSYLNVVTGSDECKVLHDMILSSSAVNSMSERFDFHPHVTIAHNVGNEALENLKAKFVDFSASFIGSKICVDILDTNGGSKTVAVLSLGN